MANATRSSKKTGSKKGQRKPAKSQARKGKSRQGSTRSGSKTSSRKSKADEQAQRDASTESSTSTVATSPVALATGTALDTLFGIESDPGQAHGQPATGIVEHVEEVDEASQLSELHRLVEELSKSVKSQMRELQEATRSIDELRAQAPRRTDVMEGRTYLSQDMRALVEPLQSHTNQLSRRVQWTFGIVVVLAVLAVPALVKALVG